MEKLDPGLHSTKGVGKTEPDPAGTKELDGCKVNNFNLDLSSSFLSLTVNKWTAQVPAGAGVKDGNKKTDLLYNEYIVYDVAQVPGSYFTLLFIIIYNQDIKGSRFQNVD